MTAPFTTIAARLAASSVCLTVAGCLAFTGCNGDSSPASRGPSAAGAKFLLSTQPADAINVVDCRRALEESKEPQDVVLVARVGGLSQPTWDPQRAIFMVADLSLQEHEDATEAPPGHDADNCPFCKARKQSELASMAMIQIVNSEGQIPRENAQELLGLVEGQEVVIRGTAELDKLGTLVVRTSGIYVKSGGID